MKKKLRSSALLIVMMIVAGVATVGFGAQRLALVQYNQSTKEEDNTYAYYAAKAGVEDALARFRWDRNVETPENQVHRIGLAPFKDFGKVEASKKLSTESLYKPASQYYDLDIKYKTNVLQAYNGTSNYTLKQDDYIELTGFETTAGAITTLNFNGLSFTNTNAFIQVQVISKPTAGEEMVLTQTQIKNSSQSVSLLNNGTPLSVRMRSYYEDASFKMTTDVGSKFDSLWTKVIVTGYYGDAKRTLMGAIDRKSGTLLGIYDFNLYAGDSISP